MKYFGTDGIRGEANKELNIDLIVNLGLAIGYHLKTYIVDRKPIVLLGTDTRISGYMIRSALATGLTAMGVNIEFVGVIPTPGVSYLTRIKEADLGIMISASHNPIKDNGIKIFSKNGEKISDDIALKLEKLIDNREIAMNNLAFAEKLGRFTFVEDDVKKYRNYLKSTVKNRFDGYKIVLDAGNGAAYRVASKVFQSLGAEIVVINNIPNGKNINVNCGSTNTKTLREVVKIVNADLGFAFDGDADRLIAVDELGNEIDGDQIIGLLATNMKEKGKLNDNTVVTTVMSNMGFENYLKNNNIKLVRANVGDRYVLEKMRDLGLNLGGEQSGHIVMYDYNTTGDGTLAALQLLSLIVEKKEKLSKLVKDINLWPQKMENIKLENRESIKVLEDEAVINFIDEIKKEIENKGRILIRVSGTEPLIRVMVEAKTDELVEFYVNKISTFIKEKLDA